jgi:hypothetical protein
MRSKYRNPDRGGEDLSNTIHAEHFITTLWRIGILTKTSYMAPLPPPPPPPTPPALRSLQRNLLNAARNLLDSRLLRRPVLALLRGLDALASGLFRLLALLLGLLRRRFFRLLFLGLARLLAAKLLAPLLLLLGLDLREEVARFADLVVDGQRARLPVIRDDEELGVELREDVGGGFGPVFFCC